MTGGHSPPLRKPRTRGLIPPEKIQLTFWHLVPYCHRGARQGQHGSKMDAETCVGPGGFEGVADDGAQGEVGQLFGVAVGLSIGGSGAREIGWPRLCV